VSVGLSSRHVVKQARIFKSINANKNLGILHQE